MPAGGHELEQAVVAVLGVGERLRRVAAERALAAARALMRHTELDAEAIARASLEVAAEICIYTNANLSLETLP